MIIGFEIFFGDASVCRNFLGVIGYQKGVMDTLRSLSKA
jgi:hypothetical protein